MYLYTHTSKKGNIFSFFYEFNPEKKEVLIKKYRIDFLNKTTNKCSFLVVPPPFKKVCSSKHIPNDFKVKMSKHISQLQNHTPIKVPQDPASSPREKNQQKHNFCFKKLKIDTFRIKKLNSFKTTSPKRNIYYELKEKSQKIKCYSPYTTKKILHIPHNHLNPFNNIFNSTCTRLSTSIGILLAGLMVKILSSYSAGLLPLLSIVFMIASLGIIIGKGLEVQSNYQSQLITIKS
jgi:hypothetical protein